MTTPPEAGNPVTRWLKTRQQSVLESAYREALAIKALEDQYYDGGKIAFGPGQSRTVYDYVRSLRDRKLLQIRTNLTQFRVNSFLLNQTPKAADASSELDPGDTEDEAVLDQLNLIESVIGKYRESPEDQLAAAATQMSREDSQLARGGRRSPESSPDAQTEVAEVVDPAIIDAESSPSSRKRIGFLGGSLLRRELDPQYEQKVVRELRLQRQQNQVALRWLAILVLVPLLIGLLSRHFVFGPLLGTYSDKYPNQVELSNEIQEEFAFNLNRYKEQLEVKALLGIIPEMSPEQQQDLLSEKATELWREAREEELNGLKNLMADLLALAVFAGLVYFNRSRLTILRSATNRTFLSLSDPGKVFVFILVTDMFVGFHSAEGWTVLLNGIGNHFGLPENEAAIGLFIATVPVFLDSCIKFWIFSYLTRFSPSSSAIYERMNT
jgi:hypothetical protein